MGKYLVIGSYTAEGAKGLLKEGGTSRRAETERLVTALGGKLEAYYFGFGKDDFYVLVDMPGQRLGRGRPPDRRRDRVGSRQDDRVTDPRGGRRGGGQGGRRELPGGRAVARRGPSPRNRGAAVMTRTGARQGVAPEILSVAGSATGPNR